MRHLNKLTTIFSASLGLLALSACEGGDLYNIDSPDWIAQRADSIANSKTPEGEPELEGMMEDVYTIGKTDFTSGWWAEFSKYYVIPDGKVWNAQFTLNINPNATNTYKNFALIICTDGDRGANTEYGAIRFDHQPSGNSEWGDAYLQNYRNNVESNLTFQTDTDAGVEKLGGKVTLTIDRSDPNAFFVKITNGTVTKTLKINEPLPNLNADETNTNIRAFLVPEGSYIDFIATNIEPIGGCTSAFDKQPVEMALKGVPEEVLVGTPLEEAMAKVFAEVTFEEGVSKTVALEDLYIEAVPGAMDELGSKTLIAMYNKTFKGENCDKPLIATLSFNVVSDITPFTEKTVVVTPGVVGLEDNSTPWWAHFSDNIKVESRQTVNVEFTNYSNCATNYNNFCIVLDREDLTEYGVVRADCWGWGTGIDGNPAFVKTIDWEDWDGWRAAMDGAKVKASIANNGDGTATVKAEILGNDGNTYHVSYEGISGIDKENMYFRFVCEGAHLVFASENDYKDVITINPSVVGLEDNSTPWWAHFSDNVKVEPAHTAIVSFTNYSNCATNYNNFCVILNREDLSEYGVVRADCWGWGTSIDNNPNFVKTIDWEDWDGWRAAMDGAKVTAEITNNGDGTATVKAEIIGNDGNTYHVSYEGISGIEKDNLYFRFVCEGAHLVFDAPAKIVRRR